MTDQFENEAEALGVLSHPRRKEVSGGFQLGNAFFARVSSDLFTAGTAELYWNSKSGKKKFSELKAEGA